MQAPPSLESLINNKSSLAVYRLFCCSVYFVDYLDLYLACKSYKKTFSASKKSQAAEGTPLERAKEITHRFLRADSVFRVTSIPAQFIDKVEWDIDNNVLSKRSFLDIQNYTLQFLEVNTYQLFLQNPAYKKLTTPHEKSTVEIKPDEKQEIEKLFKLVKDTHTNLTTIHGFASKALDSRTTTSRNAQSMANSFVQHSSTVENNSLLANILKQAGKSLESLEELQFQSTESLVNKFETPLNNLLKGELGAAYAQKKRYDLKKSDPMLHQSVDTMTDCVTKCENQLLRSVYDLLEEYYQFFYIGNKMMHQILPLLAEYRAELELAELDSEERFQLGEKYTIPEVEIIKQGLMEKKGEKRRNWTSRWFILKSGYLFYFDNNQDLNLKGVIHLKNCKVKAAANTKKPHCLSVITPSRTYFISASTEREMNFWISAIDNATVENETLRRLESLRKGSGQSTPQQAFASPPVSRVNINLSKSSEHAAEEQITSPGTGLYEDYTYAALESAPDNAELFPTGSGAYMKPPDFPAPIPEPVPSAGDSPESSTGTRPIPKPLPPVPPGKKKSDSAVPSISTAMVQPSPTTPRAEGSPVETAVVPSPRVNQLEQEGLRSSLGASSNLSASREQLVKQGYLTKKGAKRRNWSLRWFILRRGQLAYYKNPSDNDPKGIISLEGCTVEVGGGSVVKKPCCFTITSPERTYYITAKTGVDVESWVSVIRTCII